MPPPRQRDGTALERYPRHIITKRTKYENQKKEQNMKTTKKEQNKKVQKYFFILILYKCLENQ
jgi:hypothetical protein